MQRTVMVHGVDFEVEFTEDGVVEEIYIGGVEVSEVIREATEVAIRSKVSMHSDDWFAECRQEAADAQREYLREAA